MVWVHTKEVLWEVGKELGGEGGKQGSNIKFIQKCFVSHSCWMNDFWVEQEAYFGWGLVHCSLAIMSA